MITLPGDLYRHGVFPKSSEQESPIQDGRFQIMNGVTPIMNGQDSFALPSMLYYPRTSSFLLYLLGLGRKAWIASRRSLSSLSFFLLMEMSYGAFKRADQGTSLNLVRVLSSLLQHLTKKYTLKFIRRKEIFEDLILIMPSIEYTGIHPINIFNQGWSLFGT
ncbi:magnesium transporter [Striga asiatica]|uniref:Magnesium transporter n=1 Tax=Striga asiatica TaxID=4170 RepID=A0A5A7QU64_STRAF|nr:magnesium transporter [Striga asiatica]